MKLERDWLVPCGMLVFVQWTIAVLAALLTGYGAMPPIAGSVAIGLMWAGIGISCLILSARKPLAEAYHVRRDRILNLILGFGLLSLQFAVLAWCKFMIDARTGLWADPVLANLDYKLFGVDPWTLIHPMKGGLLIGVLYWSWIPLTSIFILAVLLHSPSEDRTRSIVTFFMVFAFGTLFQFVLPSGGPLFYDLEGHGNRFVALLADVPANALVARRILWDAQTNGMVEAGLGISAMPSMHVAVCLWMVFAARALWRWLTLPAAAFFAIILFGSVYQGLHYFVDGLAAALFVSLAYWWASGWDPATFQNVEKPGAHGLVMRGFASPE